MRECIRQTLREIERAGQVKILYAAESGSRAWGFASPDSDYDVRFLYLRRTEDYLKLDRPRDVIEWQLDETLDVNGWDLQKALRLLRNSNPTLFEWAGSPIVYRSTPQWEALRPLLDRCFSPKRGMHHYLNMAARNYHAFRGGEQVRMKRYLYALRPILACKWIMANRTPPPMRFAELTEALLEESVKPVAAALLEKKLRCPECGLIPRIETLHHYIEENLSALTQSVQDLSEPAEDRTPELDNAFLRLVSGS